MFEVEYYKDNDCYPVLNFLLTIPTKEKAKILREIDMLKQFGFALGMPYIKKIEGFDKLWELRVKYSSHNYRVFFFHYSDGLFVLLHSILKKSAKIPKRDIDLALSRINSYIKGKEDKI